MKRKLAEEYGMMEDGPAGARNYVRLTFIGFLLTFPYPLPRSWSLPPGDPYVPYTSAEAPELKRRIECY